MKLGGRSIEDDSNMKNFSTFQGGDVPFGAGNRGRVVGLIRALASRVDASKKINNSSVQVFLQAVFEWKNLSKPDVVVVRVIRAVGILEGVKLHGQAVWNSTVPKI